METQTHYWVIFFLGIQFLVSQPVVLDIKLKESIA